MIGVAVASIGDMNALIPKPIDRAARCVLSPVCQLGSTATAPLAAEK
jgi:hypothetical protein